MWSSTFLDEDGRPSFNTLQNYGSAGARLHFFIFDVLILKGKDVMGDPLMQRRALIEEHVFPTLAELFVQRWHAPALS
jgi:ATP-dependent DNA ligase